MGKENIGLSFLESNCRNRVSYHIFKRPAKALIKDIEIDYEEYYGKCDECKCELYVPELEDQNEEIIEDIYRHKRQLITISQIKNIMEKYNVEKRPLSRLLGFGELTITRYIDGQLPSKRYSDLLLEVLNDEQKMKTIVEANKNCVSAVTLKKVSLAIEHCEREKVYTDSAERIALYIIRFGREITNLLLQKVLYYVKAIGKVSIGTYIIPEPCEAWRYGPVFPTVYEKYKEFGKQEITIDLSEDYVESLLSEEEKSVVDLVLNTYGIYNAWFLKDLTHLEEPWIVARNGVGENDIGKNEMDNKLISDYFERMNEIFDLKSMEGIDLYINEMKKKMYH